MARYHFHAYNGRAIADEAGSEHATVADARFHAMRHLAEVLCEKAGNREGCDDLTLEVTDKEGLILFSMTLSVIDAPAMIRAR